MMMIMMPDRSINQPARHPSVGFFPGLLMMTDRRAAALISASRSALKSAHHARPFAMPRASSTAAGVVEGGGAAPEKKKVRARLPYACVSSW